jgi:hypothetical protein
MPCRYRRRLFSIWFTQCGLVCHVPCRATPRLCYATTIPFWKRVLKATARYGRGMGMACVNLHWPSRDGMWATCMRSVSSGYQAEFHEGYQRHINPLNCRTSSWDISGYHADFHEGHGTVGEWQGHGRVCVGLALRVIRPPFYRTACIEVNGATYTTELEHS